MNENHEILVEKKRRLFHIDKEENTNVQQQKPNTHKMLKNQDNFSRNQSCNKQQFGLSTNTLKRIKGRNYKDL